MLEANKPAPPSADRELVLSRTFDAPRARVFEAWTRAEHVGRWFSPRPLTTTRCEVDLRPGGAFVVVMRMPSGVEHPFTATFTEVVANERIRFTGTLEDGNVLETTVTFAEAGARGDKTALTVRQTYAFVSDATRGAPQGWASTLDQLGEVVAALAG